MRHKYMVRDDATKLFDALETTWWTHGSTYDSTYYVDLGAADGSGVDEKDPGMIVAMLTGMTSSGSAVVGINIRDCDTAGGTYAVLTPVQVLVPDATAFDATTWADAIYLPLPDFGVRQFVKLAVTVATAALTAGVIDAWYTKRAQ